MIQFGLILEFGRKKFLELEVKFQLVSRYLFYILLEKKRKEKKRKEKKSGGKSDFHILYFRLCVKKYIDLRASRLMPRLEYILFSCYIIVVVIFLFHPFFSIIRP